MSAYDYHVAKSLAAPRFSALVMAALLRGDERQRERLARAFPEIWQELEARRHSPDGRTAAEAAFDALELPPQ